MPIPILAGIGLATGIIGGIGKMFGRGKANRELNKLIKQNPTYTASYQENPYAKNRLGLATTLLNARMPGAVQAERNIYTNQANQLSNLNRNATDASQAIAAAAGIGGQTNQAFTNLGLQESQDYQRRYENLSNAQEGMIREGDKVFQDKLREFDDRVRRFNDLAAIRGVQQQNRQANWGDISNLGFGLAQFGMSGGMNGLFNQGGGGFGGVTGSMMTPNPSSLNNIFSGASPAAAFGGNIPYNPLFGG